MSGEQTVGSILGFLRLDADQFHREIAKAMGEVAALEGSDLNVKVKADTTGAERGLTQVGRASRTASSDMDNAAHSSIRLKDAADKVRIAETKLGEAQSKYHRNASQILTAEHAVTLARRAEQDAIFGTYSANLNLANAEEKAVASGKKAETASKKIDKSSRDAGKGVGALATAIITLGPALVPLAVGATGLAAAFGGMGAAGVLAIVGIRNEMKAGTAIGNAYSRGLQTAKDDLTKLASVAAGNVLAPFQGSVRDLQTKMPALSKMVDGLSTVTGKTAAAITSGLVSAFISLGPLMRDASVYILNLSQRFQNAMSGGGITAFGDYVRSVFPQVMQSVESIVTAAMHLVAAFAPLGGGTLSIIKIFADVIAAIDPTALTAVATAAGAVFIGFRSWQGLSGLVKKLGDALGGVESMSLRAAAGMNALKIASGIIGIALAGLSIAMTLFSTDSTTAQAATDNLTDALIRSNGAIDNNVRLSALKNAQDSGALDNARMLGISTQQVVDAYLGQAGALGDLSAQRDAALSKQRALVDAGKADASTMTDVYAAYVNLKNQLAAAGIQWDDTKVKIQQHNDALKKTTGSITATDTAAQNMANTYGTSLTTYQQVVAAQKKSADQAQLATTQMRLENDAAGLLKQSLDALAGKSLSAAQAQNSFDSSLANMGDHTTATGKKIKFTTTSIKDMSAASVSLRGQLLGQVTAAEQTAEAYGQMKGSSEAGRLKLVDLRDQIIKNAVAHGVDKKAVTNYVDSVLKIPTSVPPTKLDVDKAVASQKVKEFVGLINGIPTYKDVFINVGTNAGSAVASVASSLNGIGASLFPTKKKATGGVAGLAAGGPVPGFAGGTLVGPGTGTSDSILSMVAQTGHLLRVSAGEFISTDASRRRNRGALEAGNKGATLSVAGEGGRLHPEDIGMLARALGREIGRMPTPQLGLNRLDAALGGF